MPRSASGHRPGSRHGAAYRWRGMLADPELADPELEPPNDDSGAHLLVGVSGVPA